MELRELTTEWIWWFWVTGGGGGGVRGGGVSGGGVVFWWVVWLWTIGRGGGGEGGGGGRSSTVGGGLGRRAGKAGPERGFRRRYGSSRATSVRAWLGPVRACDCGTPLRGGG